MLCVPALTETDGLTIYADDTEFWRFYPIPTEPRIREQDGEPVLLLISYAVSDEDRAANPDLPPGGGYLSLDTVLAPTKDQLEGAAAVLQREVDVRWEQLRNGTPEDQARPGVAGTGSAPKVVFGTPTFTDGAVKLDAPQSERLVSSRLAAGTPTLLPGNVATFNLDLTPDGAQFVADSLIADEAAAAPLQVAYDLSFWARLPAARIHMAIDASKMHEYIRKQLEGRGVEYCTTYDYDHSDVTQESMTLSGAVTVQIDTGSGSIPDDVISELRGYAFDTLKQLVQSTFFQPAPASPPPAAPSGIRVPYYRDSTLLVQTLNQQTMNVSLDLEQSSVVEWKIHPKATLTGVVGDDEAMRERHVRKLALDDPFFSDINVAVEVFTDFALVDHVEVELSHDGTTSDGQPRHESTVFTFTTPGAQKWRIRRFTDANTYDIRHRVIFPGGRTGEWAPWETKDSPRVAISVESPGVVQATATVGNVDFDALVASAQVTFAYQDAARGVAEERSVVVLTKDARTQTYERPIGVPVSGTLKYRVRFDLVTGDVIEDDDWSDLIGDQVVVNQPAESVLRVNLLPAGNAWATLVAVFVTLEYSDADGNVTSNTFDLRKIEEFRTWQVYLRDRTRRGYRYRWTASFLDGTTTTKDWTDNAGDPVLSILLNRTAVNVLVVADAVDFVACPLVEVTLRSANPPATTTMVFRDRAPQMWILEGARAEDLAITVDITQFPAGQPPIHLPQRIENDSVVALPAARRGVALRFVNAVGTLVDYSVTPIVGIDIEAGEGPDVSVSLMLNVNIQDGIYEFDPGVSVTSYRYRITYFDKTGKPSEGTWQTATFPRIVVPAFTA